MNDLPSQRPVVHPACAACLILVMFAWLASPSSVRAAPPPAAPASVSVTFAASDGWGVRKLFGGLNSRARIIQIAIACMALGLFILMRKMTE